jgi:hypothetical protein
MADEKVEKVAEVYQIHLNDFLQYLSYLIDKGEAEKQEMDFQDNLRKAKRGK